MKARVTASFLIRSENRYDAFISYNILLGGMLYPYESHCHIAVLQHENGGRIDIVCNVAGTWDVGKGKGE